MHKFRLKIVFPVLERNLSLCGYVYVYDGAGDAVATAAAPVIGQHPT